MFQRALSIGSVRRANGSHAHLRAALASQRQSGATAAVFAPPDGGARACRPACRRPSLGLLEGLQPRPNERRLVRCSVKLGGPSTESAVTAGAHSAARQTAWAWAPLRAVGGMGVVVPRSSSLENAVGAHLSFCDGSNLKLSLPHGRVSAVAHARRQKPGRRFYHSPSSVISSIASRRPSRADSPAPSSMAR